VYILGDHLAASTRRFFWTVCKFSRLHAGKPPGGGCDQLAGRSFLGRSNERISDTVFRGMSSLPRTLPNKREELTLVPNPKSGQRCGATRPVTIQCKHPTRMRWILPTSSKTGREADGLRLQAAVLGAIGQELLSDGLM